MATIGEAIQNSMREEGFLGKFLKEQVENFAHDSAMKGALGEGVLAQLTKSCEKVVGTKMMQDIVLPAIEAGGTSDAMKAQIRSALRAMKLPGVAEQIITTLIEGSIEGLRDASRIKDGSDTPTQVITKLKGANVDEAKEFVKIRVESKRFSDLVCLLSMADQTVLDEWAMDLKAKRPEAYKLWTDHYMLQLDTVPEIVSLVEFVSGRMTGGPSADKTMDWLAVRYPNAVPTAKDPEKKSPFLRIAEALAGATEKAVSGAVGLAEDVAKDPEATARKIAKHVDTARRRQEEALLVTHNRRRRIYSKPIDFTDIAAFEDAVARGATPYNSVTEYVRDQKF